MTQETSLTAYYTKVLPHLGEKQAIVYNRLRDATRNGFDMTDKELCKSLHWEINCVVPRRNELCKMGVVVVSRRRLCSVTENMALAWRTEK